MPMASSLAILTLFLSLMSLSRVQVFARPGNGRVFEDDEYVVYNADAIRAAYLVLYETPSGA